MLNSNIEKFTSDLTTILDNASSDRILKRQNIIRLYNELIARCNIQRRTSKIPQVIDLLFDRPIVDTFLVKNQLGISHVGADKIINKLLDANILTPIGMKNRGSKYICREILEL